MSLTLLEAREVLKAETQRGEKPLRLYREGDEWIGVWQSATRGEVWRDGVKISDTARVVRRATLGLVTTP
jgi:hypothetical protein